MKILEYTEENLETIAREKGFLLSEIKDNFAQANNLGMTIYSTIDYIFFNTGYLGTHVTFVAKSIIDEHFDVTPGPPGVYLEAVPKNRN